MHETDMTACAAGTETIPKIEAGIQLGERLNVFGTPTVLLNGWQYQGPPSKDRLITAIDALLRGKEPV